MVGGYGVGNLDRVQVSERVVDRGMVLAHHLVAAATVGLFDGRLDAGDGGLGRNCIGEAEKARLHDGVDALLEPLLPGEACRVYGIELQPLVIACSCASRGSLLHTCAVCRGR